MRCVCMGSIWVAYHMLRLQMQQDRITCRHQTEPAARPKHQTQTEVITERPCQTRSTQHINKCRCMSRYSLNTILWLTSTTALLCWQAACYCYKPKQASASHPMEDLTQKCKNKHLAWVNKLVQLLKTNCLNQEWSLLIPTASSASPSHGGVVWTTMHTLPQQSCSDVSEHCRKYV